MTSQQLGDLRESVGQPRIGRQRATVDAEGHCVICGIGIEPDSLSMEKHECPPGFRAPKQSKYKAVRCQDAKGNKFDSKAELARWEILKLMETQGHIRMLERQPRFPMEIKEGVFIGTYVADFRYKRISQNQWVVEDVKGFKTPLYKFKKKIVEALYDIKITEIQA